MFNSIGSKLIAGRAGRAAQILAQLAGYLKSANNLSDVPSAPTARTNLGLGSAATATASALTETNDTNITLTLGGTPATALLEACSLTLGWTGTLAAGRLNANVVQGITNDTNVTGSISAQDLTLGWTGTLAVARGGTGVVSVTTAPTASAFAGWDASKNLSANNLIDGFTTTVTSGSTVTLTIASTGIQTFTGSTAQLVTLPTTSVAAGGQYLIINASSAVLTVQSSGANSIVAIGAGTSCLFTAQVATPTTAANWNFSYVGVSIASGKLLKISNSLTLAGTDSTTMTFPSANANIAALNLAAQVQSGGVHITVYNIGTVSSGTTTIDCGNGPQQCLQNGGASTIAAPASDGNCLLQVINGPSAGTITLSGFHTSPSGSGDTFATTLTVSAAAVTVTSASPAVITYTNTFVGGEPVYFTAATIPTGMTASTIYYVLPTGLTTAHFSISATPSGTAINTTSTGTTVVIDVPSVFAASIFRINGLSTLIWKQQQ